MIGLCAFWGCGGASSEGNGNRESGTSINAKTGTELFEIINENQENAVCDEKQCMINFQVPVILREQLKQASSAILENNSKLMLPKRYYLLSSRRTFIWNSFTAQLVVRNADCFDLRFIIEHEGSDGMGYQTRGFDWLQTVTKLSFPVLIKNFDDYFLIRFAKKINPDEDRLFFDDYPEPHVFVAFEIKRCKSTGENVFTGYAIYNK